MFACGSLARCRELGDERIRPRAALAQAKNPRVSGLLSQGDIKSPKRLVLSRPLRIPAPRGAERARITHPVEDPVFFQGALSGPLLAGSQSARSRRPCCLLALRPGFSA
jgi:hypothetical protein